ncbi:MAG TPA: S4 domain-containing protein YaaA [Bacilli bacterium]
MKIIKISTEYITLGQLLKLTREIQNGAEAKYYLQEKRVLVNDEEENRRGRKLYKGDIVITEKEKYRIET